MPARNPASPFRSIRPGDTVTRILGGHPMQLGVTEVDEEFIYCGGDGSWKFDLDTGWEVDEGIGWGPASGITGSFLLPPIRLRLDESRYSARRPNRRLWSVSALRPGAGMRWTTSH